MAKSPNKHNRLWCKAQPLEKDLVEAIEQNTFDPQIYHTNILKMSSLLVEKFKWNSNDAKKIWCFGP